MASHAEHSYQGSDNGFSDVRQDSASANGIDRHTEEQVAEPGLESIHEEEEEPSPLATSLNGTTQFSGHDTPASHAVYLDSTAATIREENRSNRPGSAPPSLRRGVRTSSDKSSTPKKQSILKPRNDDHRVAKPKQAPHRSSSPPPTSETSNVSRTDEAENIEEVLLYLIGCNRNNAELRKRWEADIHRLETEKQALQDISEAQKQDLAQTRQQWQTALQSNHVHDAEVRDLKSKYENLKKAVQIFAQTSEDLGKDRDKLMQELSSLKSTNSAVVKDRRELLKQCVATSAQFTKVKNEISALRTKSNSYAGVQDELLRTKESLREEKLCNKEHALYIQRLEGLQRSWHTASDTKQNELVRQINTVLAILNNQNRDQPVADSMQPITLSLEQIQQHLGKLPTAESMENISEGEKSKYEGIKDALKSVQNSIDDQHAAADLQFSNVISSVANLEPKVALLQQLETDKAKLLQQTSDVNMANAELRKSQTSSQLMCTGLLETQRQMLSREKSTINVGKTIQELIESKNKAINLVTSKQQESDKLKSDLKQAATDLVQAKQEIITLQNQFRSKNEQTVQDYQSLIDIAREEAQKEKQAYDQSIAEQRQLLHEEQNRVQEMQGSLLTFEKTVQTNKKLEADLRDVLSQKKDLEDTVTECHNNMARLNGDIAIAMQTTTKLQANVELNKELNQTVKKLRDQLADQKAQAHEKLKKQEKSLARLKSLEVDLAAAMADLTESRAHSQNLEQDLLRFAPIRSFITDEEIDELTEPVILSLKSQIAASQSQNENGQMSPPPNIGTRPKQRMASHRNKARSLDSQGEFVQDSQSQDAQSGQTQAYRRSPSPELIDESIDAFFDMDNATHAPSNHIHPASNAAHRSQVNHRPGTSNNEMLLRSPDSVIEPLAQPHESTIQVPASSYSLSPMKTRNGSQIRHNISETQIDPARVRASTPASQQRDNHAPNSAAKRQITADEDNLSSKKPRLQHANLKNLEVRAPSSVLTPKQTRFAENTTVYPAATGTTKSTGVAGSTAPAPGSMRKRTNTTKQSSRTAAHANRFTKGT